MKTSNVFFHTKYIIYGMCIDDSLLFNIYVYHTHFGRMCGGRVFPSEHP